MVSSPFTLNPAHIWSLPVRSAYCSCRPFPPWHTLSTIKNSTNTHVSCSPPPPIPTIHCPHTASTYLPYRSLTSHFTSFPAVDINHLFTFSFYDHSLPTPTIHSPSSTNTFHPLVLNKPFYSLLLHNQYLTLLFPYPFTTCQYYSLLHNYLYLRYQYLPLTIHPLLQSTSHPWLLPPPIVPPLPVPTSHCSTTYGTNHYFLLTVLPLKSSTTLCSYACHSLG